MPASGSGGRSAPVRPTYHVRRGTAEVLTNGMPPTIETLMDLIRHQLVMGVPKEAELGSIAHVQTGAVHSVTFGWHIPE